MNVERLHAVCDAIAKNSEAFGMHYWDCGTSACIAGWAIRLFGKSRNYDPMASIFAKDLLGLDLNQSWLLFHVNHWPDSFQFEYERANSSEDKAMVAIRRIKHLIETGE